jgi:hypothetical protein
LNSKKIPIKYSANKQKEKGDYGVALHTWASKHRRTA